MWRRRTAAIMLASLTLSVAAPTAQSLLRKLLRIAGITAGGAVRGPADDEVVAGDIWVADLDDGTRRAWTSSGVYRTPVFAPTAAAVFALKGDAVVRLDSRGRETPVGNVPGAEKLVGLDPDIATDLVVLRQDMKAPLVVLSLKTAKVTPMPYDAASPEERRAIASIRRQARSYGDTTVYLQRESKPGATRLVQWTDVFVRRGEQEPRNVSGCDGVSCSQPALSADGRRLAFVKVRQPR